MENQERNKRFIDLIDADTKSVIVNSIAAHYKTDEVTIIEELTNNDETEHLLDYMNEPHRTATSLKSSDQDTLDNEENFNTLSALYADDVIDSDEKLTDDDLDRIQNKIHQNLENTFPDFI